MNQKNNSILSNLRNSGIFLPLLLFIAFVIGNHFLLFQKNYVGLDWHYFFAIFGGCSKDLFFFCIFGLAFHLISKLIPALKNIFIITLHSFILFPILDYYVFKATLERFNWNILQFVHYHSIKGYLGNMGFNIIYLLLAIVFITITCYSSCKKSKQIAPAHLKPFIAVIIFLLFSSIFTWNIEFVAVSKFTGHLETLKGKNRILSNLTAGSVQGFFRNYKQHTNGVAIKSYTNDEREFLTANNFLPNNPKTTSESKFDRIIMVVMESMAYEYIHYNNPDIPAETSPYLDYLTANYPHLTNFYTSDYPTLHGLNAMLSSKIPFNAKNTKLQKHNLAAIFEESHKSLTWFVRGDSRVYGNEEINILNVFGFSNLIGYEDLAKHYPEPGEFTWGYRDSTVCAEALNILSKMKNKNYFMVIKLLDQHQPIFNEVLKASGKPESVEKHHSDIVKAVYETDKLLKEFLTICESEGIFDDRTLIIVTADHYPPLGYGHTELIKSETNFQLGKLPLIFVTKQKQAFSSLQTDKLCCQLDIAPTICELLGTPIPEQYMGHSLLDNSFAGRSIGILNNETLFFQSDKLEFSEKLSEPATQTIAIKKWINNLNASLSQD